MYRRRRFSLGAAVIAVCIVVGGLAWDSCVANREASRARTAAISACVISGVPDAECRRSIEASSQTCFNRHYTPRRSKGRYTASVPAHFNAAGYEECLARSTPEWAEKRRSAQQGP